MLFIRGLDKPDSYVTDMKFSDPAYTSNKDQLKDDATFLAAFNSAILPQSGNPQAEMALRQPLLNKLAATDLSTLGVDEREALIQAAWRIGPSGYRQFPEKRIDAIIEQLDFYSRSQTNGPGADSGAAALVPQSGAVVYTTDKGLQITQGLIVDDENFMNLAATVFDDASGTNFGQGILGTRADMAKQYNLRRNLGISVDDMSKWSVEERAGWLKELERRSKDGEIGGDDVVALRNLAKEAQSKGSDAPSLNIIVNGKTIKYSQDDICENATFTTFAKELIGDTLPKRSGTVPGFVRTDSDAALRKLAADIDAADLSKLSFEERVDFLGSIAEARKDGNLSAADLEALSLKLSAMTTAPAYVQSTEYTLSMGATVSTARMGTDVSNLATLSVELSVMTTESAYLQSTEHTFSNGATVSTARLNDTAQWGTAVQELFRESRIPLASANAANNGSTVSANQNTKALLNLMGRDVSKLDTQKRIKLLETVITSFEKYGRVDY